MIELREGETLEIQGSAPDPYVIRNHGTHYSCTCPSWTFQKGAPARKTCKHLKAVLGEAHEALRTSVTSRKVRPRTGRTIADCEGREYELDEETQ